MPDKVLIAKVGKPYGIRGFARLYSYSSSAKNIFNYTKLYILSDDNYVHINHTIKQIGDEKLIIAINNISSPEEISLYTNKNIYIDKIELKASKGEYYWHELISMPVFDENKQAIGKIISIIETGSNDVLVIQYEEKTFTIPYLLGQSIINIDIANNNIIVSKDFIIEN